jgi:hypothetical protein
VKVLWSILCQDAVIDRETNNVSLFNIVEEVSIPVEPPTKTPTSVAPQRLTAADFALVTLWARSDEKVGEQGRGRIRLVLPDTKEVAQSEFEVDLTTYLRSRFVMRFHGLPGGDQGTYRFIIESKDMAGDWVQMFELPLRVAIQSQESG